MRGSVQIEKARNIFRELLDVVVDIASLQTAFIKLDKVIKITSRRVNALEYIVIPRFKEIVIYITEELEEQEREEKFLMKKVLGNKRKHNLIREQERLRKIQEMQQATQMIMPEEDDDTLF